MSVLKEIQKVCKIKPKGPKEKEQKFLIRVLTEVDEAGEEAWDKLSSAAQQWYNSAAKAHNDGEALPPVPSGKAEKVSTKAGKKAKAEADDEEDEDDDDEDSDDEDEEDEDSDDDDDDEEDEDSDDDDDDDDEDDDEDDEDEDEGPESIDIAAAKKGSVITVQTNGGDVHSGKLTFRSKTKVKVGAGKKEVEVARDDIAATFEGKVEPPALKTTKAKAGKTAKAGKAPKEPKPEKLNKRQQVIDMICQNPNLSEAKVKALVKKAKIEVTDPTFNGAYKSVQFVIERLGKHHGVKID